MTIAFVELDLTLTDTFSAGQDDNFQAEAGTDGIILQGKFNISIQGDWTGTLTLQRSFDKGVVWKDVKEYLNTDDQTIEEQGEETESEVQYRIGYKPSETPTNTATVRLSR